jgi:hypothetical protein
LDAHDFGFDRRGFALAGYLSVASAGVVAVVVFDGVVASVAIATSVTLARTAVAAGVAVLSVFAAWGVTVAIASAVMLAVTATMVLPVVTATGIAVAPRVPWLDVGVGVGAGIEVVAVVASVSLRAAELIVGEIPLGGPEYVVEGVGAVVRMVRI